MELASYTIFHFAADDENTSLSHPVSLARYPLVSFSRPGLRTALGEGVCIVTHVRLRTIVAPVFRRYVCMDVLATLTASAQSTEFSPPLRRYPTRRDSRELGAGENNCAAGKQRGQGVSPAWLVLSASPR